MSATRGQISALRLGRGQAGFSINNEVFMKHRIVLTLALAAAFSPLAIAQQAKPTVAAVMAASAPGKGGVVGAVKVTATVVALDAATRTATLKGEKGKIVDVVVPPEAKNFDQIRVGDLVTVEYMRALTLELKGKGSIRSGSSQAASAPAPAGAVAGGSVARQVVVLANVTAVNAKENVITLRGPKGNSVDVTVDPSQLKLVKVGDQVEAVYTEAVAVTVEHVKKAAAK
jgi:Cu/Ag efflux protein CusF